MARLGMRAGEVRQLNLNDIDWIEGEIHVRAGKSRRERTLPLFEEVGKALSVYLREERPESAERSIFLTLLPPYRPLAYSTAISKISRHIFEEAGVQGPRLGAHRVRHTVATEAPPIWRTRKTFYRSAREKMIGYSHSYSHSFS